VLDVWQMEKGTQDARKTKFFSFGNHGGNIKKMFWQAAKYYSTDCVHIF
jgi:hypothetical protein